ncbi:MAG: AEC family transporter [Clostridia bacterium]|nr:AEC family transporter [Clostridia bacterium]
MSSFIFALNAVAPIVIMMAIGYVLKRINFFNADFIKTANKMVFKILIPAMLFTNIYSVQSIGDVNFGYAVFAIAAVLVIFLVMTCVIMIFTKDNRRRGVLLQSSFRSNYALIGIPLAQSLFGDAGVAVAAVLSAFAIPIFNILAVISLSIFADTGKGKGNVKKVLLNIAQNPLIQSVLAGLIVVALRGLFAEWNISFRLSDIQPLFKVLSYLSGMATPLALIMVGAQFEFSVVGELRREIIFGTLTRTLVVPLLSLGTAIIFFREYFGGAEYAALTALFATPVAVSSVPMAQEMDADVTLTGQLVVWTTLISIITIFVSSLIMKQIGIF